MREDRPMRKMLHMADDDDSLATGEGGLTSSQGNLTNSFGAKK